MHIFVPFQSAITKSIIGRRPIYRSHRNKTKPFDARRTRLQLVRLLDERAQLVLVSPGHLAHLDAVRVHLERRHGGDTALTRDVLELVDVNLHELDVRVLARQFLEKRRD